MKPAFAFAAVAAIAAFAALPAAASQNWVARCAVQSGAERYDGPCIFLPEEGRGSFSAWPQSEEPFFGNIRAVSVIVVRRGVAEVRGVTADGVNSRWGAARRSRRDRACWEGSDFSICAY